MVRAVEEQAHAVLLRGHAGPTVLDPLIGKFLRNIRLTIGEIIVGFHPVHGLVLAHLAVRGEMACAQVFELHRVAHFVAIAGIGDAAACDRAVVEQVRIVGFAHVRILKHFAVLVLGAVLQNRIPIIRSLAAEHLVRQLNVLRSIETETIRTIGNGLLEQIKHALRDRGILRIQIPQSGKLVLGAILTIVVIGNLLICMEIAFVFPLVGDHIEIRREMVRNRIDDNAQAILVGQSAHFLELVFGTDHIIADGHIGRLIHVIPVQIPISSAEFAIILDFHNRLGLNGRISGFCDIRNVFHDCFERPFERVQGRAVLHVFRQTILLPCRFERRVADGVGIAVSGGRARLLWCRAAYGKACEQRGHRSYESHGFLADFCKFDMCFHHVPYWIIERI